MTQASAAATRRSWLGWLCLLALLAYGVVIHHGVGPSPDGEPHWWSPSSFLLTQAWTAPFESQPWLGTALLTLPAALFTALVFGFSRSAVAQTLALGTLFATPLFLMYGFSILNPFAWSFFHWRGSAVMIGLAFTLALTCTAPLLARSWLRLGWPARLAVYLPIWLLVVALVRNTTGTNSALPFAISPWPVVPFFGISLGVVALLGVLAGVTLGVGALAWRERQPLLLPAGLMGALIIPAIWFKLWQPDAPGRVLGFLVVMTLLVLAAALLVGTRRGALRRGALYLAAGFALAAWPTASASWWARWDYVSTRDGAAQQIIDALTRHYEREDIYPDELEELVAAGDLEAVPKNEIGFDFASDQEFIYQAFGTSYLLEFSAPGWVQCAYNPPYADDEDWEEEEADEEDLGGAWSCPSKPPELW